MAQMRVQIEVNCDRRATRVEGKVRRIGSLR